MGIITRFKSAARAFKFPIDGARGETGREYDGWAAELLPGTQRDWVKDAGNPLDGSLIYSVVSWAVRNFPQAPHTVEQLVKGSWAATHEHPILTLMNEPNEDDISTRLQASAIANYMLYGNAYWLKVRSAVGKVVELWSLPSFYIEPAYPRDGSEWISGYWYTVGVKPILLPKEDVIHFRSPLDDVKNIRKGHSAFQTLLREVVTDAEAATYSAAILTNMGVPGVVLTPKGEARINDKSDRQQIAEMYKKTTTGDHRGEALVLSGAMDITNLGVNPEQLALDTIRRIPEERIAAVFGISPIVVHFGAGLSRSTFSNYAQAEEAAWENFIVPSALVMDEALTKFMLRPDFPSSTPERVARDYSKVPALQEDEDLKAKRVVSLYTAQIIKRSEARQMIGKVSTPEDEIYAEKPGSVPSGMPPAVSINGTSKEMNAFWSEWKSRRVAVERSAVSLSTPTDDVMRADDV